MSDMTPDNHDEHDLLEIEMLLRSLTADDLVAPPAPPAGLWASIQGELAASGDLTSAAATESAPQMAAPPVVSLAEHRVRRAGPYRFLAAAAAAVVIVAGVAVVAARGGGAQDVVATAQLTWDAAAFDPLGENATARAELVQRDGGYELVLTDTTLPASVEESADLELWLIKLGPDGSPADVQPVSLVDPTSPGTYAVPANLDPDTYSVVDISIEPRDGDEAHSGRSILRGQLSA